MTATVNVRNKQVECSWIQYKCTTVVRNYIYALLTVELFSLLLVETEKYMVTPGSFIYQAEFW
jgi:hypothetical protein